MHDIFEGICIIELRLILKHVLQSSQLTLQQLNHKISTSIRKYSHDIGKFPEIHPSFIDGEKKTCFSASEMSNFFLLLPVFLLDDFENNGQFYALILMLRRIIRIIMAPIITRPGILFL
jgi:hypothetical protein